MLEKKRGNTLVGAKEEDHLSLVIIAFTPTTLDQGARRALLGSAAKGEAATGGGRGSLPPPCHRRACKPPLLVADGHWELFLVQAPVG